MAVVCAGVVVYLGWQMYSEAVAEIPVEEKIAAIMDQPDYTVYQELPKTYVDAVISAEDRRFRYHNGFDIVATARAFWRNLSNHEIVEGGSTITQQLGRIMYFSQEKKYTRKVAEVLVARDIEKLCDKDKIFELYVNTIYFGSGYYTVHEAASGYFGKLPKEMNDYECTMLAGIPNAPSVYSLDVRPDLAEQRQKKVVECMVDVEYITEEEGKLILAND